MSFVKSVKVQYVSERIPSLSQHSRMDGSSRIVEVSVFTSPFAAAWYTTFRSTSSAASERKLIKRIDQ